MGDTKALARIEPAQPAPFEPRDLAEARGLADDIARAGIIPAHLRGKPLDAYVILLFGRELGLAPMQSMLNVDLVEGKPRLNAQMTVALVKRSPLCRYFRLVESTDEVATYETLREGEPEPTRLSFTLRQAERAGLKGNNWQRHPAAMLRHRAAQSLARAVYPDVIGNVYDDDEISEMREHARAEMMTAPPPPPAQVARRNGSGPPAGARRAEHPVIDVQETSTAAVPPPTGPPPPSVPPPSRTSGPGPAIAEMPPAAARANDREIAAQRDAAGIEDGSVIAGPADDLDVLGAALARAAKLEDLAGQWERIHEVLPDERAHFVREYMRALLRCYGGVRGPGPALAALTAECGRVKAHMTPAEVQMIAAAHREAYGRQPA
jgi:hypothetical protein